MVITELTDAQLRSAYHQAVHEGVAHTFSRAWELVAYYGYDVTGRHGAAANRVKLLGQKLNRENGYDWVGAWFTQFPQLGGYEA